MVGVSVRIRGVVQGVGFRPFVWRLAHEHNLVGWVLNDAEGVLANAWGAEENIQDFLKTLEDTPPPLSKIESVESEPLSGEPDTSEFKIIQSDSGETHTGVSPDAATCPDCLADTLDPQDRRYRYPFTNCTHCGPRLSILHSVPYDRAKTSMSEFVMCEVCQQEYEDPSDRRFHAQPNACPVCGPKVWIENPQGTIIESDDPIAHTAALIKQGEIVAIKGIGGFHLACDATNAKTVSLLRERKRRLGKPFALMARDVDVINQYAQLIEGEEQQLKDRAAPIVILETGKGQLSPDIAPGQDSLGFMLPYTPLHHVLMTHLEKPVVMTSGNQSDEPQCFDNDVARERLKKIADFFLMHDRGIVNRLDDSVIRFMDDTPRFLRRARGYTPEALSLPDGFEDAPQILAMGAELKNTFCLLKDGKAVMSQHMGDLEEMAVLKDYLRTIDLFESLFDHKAAVIAIDKHSGYLSSQTGREWGKSREVPLVEVQHHHAHVAACMAEHELPADCDPVLGIVMDGLGLGEDGTIWGAEFLKAGYADFERLGHFQSMPMIGGAQSIQEPWRSAYSHLSQSLGRDELEKSYASLDFVAGLKDRQLDTLDTMVAKGLNAPLASSCGRLFDAAAAILGIRTDGVTYEGEAAILMEALAASHLSGETSNGYPASCVTMDSGLLELQWGEFWTALLDDLKAGAKPAIVAARFHQGVVNAVAGLGAQLAENESLQTVVLSGGVFQNKLMLEGVSENLRSKGLKVLTPQLYPANDGGVSLGQAMIAAARELIV